MPPRTCLAALGEDVRYALRLSRRSPAFTAVVVLILALGIGVTTAVFGLLDAVVFKSLPVHKPQELVYFRMPSFSYPILEEVRGRAGIFSGLFGWDLDRLNVAWTTELTPTETMAATGDIYSTLGVSAVVGRVFGPDDDVPGGGPGGPVAVISYAAWQRRFGGDPAVLGRTIRVAQTPFTIVGVTPAGFFGVVAGLAPEVTIPATVLAVNVEQNPERLRSHSAAWLHMMGRLKPGVSLEEANAALQVFWPQVLEATTPRTLPSDRRARFLSRATALDPGRAGFSRVRNRFSQPLQVLFSLVALLLLVSCTTLANLLLARSLARRREVAVRLALGATRGRLLRQLITESLVLALAGAAAGLIVAVWAGDGLVRLMSTTDQPLALAVTLDWRTLAFTGALAIVTAVLFTVAPALRTTAVDPAPTLKENTAAAIGRREWRLGRALVVAQVTLSVVLVTGAALFVRSVALILSQDAGFARENIIVVSTDAIAAGHRGARLAAFHSQLLDRLKTVPGVEAASLSHKPPISNQMGSWTQSIAIDGGDVVIESEARTFFNVVWPGYFDTIGMRLLQGRDVAWQDDRASRRVVVINESLARAHFPGENPLGRRISIGLAAERQTLEIVGVVQDAKYQFLQEPVRRIAYVPGSQHPEDDDENAVASVRIAGDPAAVIDAMRRAIRTLDRTVPIQFETVEHRIRESLVTERVLAILGAALGVIALVLACAGLYGLMVHVVERRTGEIGVRLALGAARADVLWLILRQSLALVVIGAAAGVSASLLLGRVVARLLYGMTATDPIAVASAVALMVTVTSIAGYLPARRAASLDPATVLRRD
jgi:predicted permease